MGLIIRISWRNLWRNPRRSLILVSAIVLCIVALLFTLAYINGILRQMVTNSVEFHLGEMEIYKKGFNDDHDPVNHISSPEEILTFLDKEAGLKGYAPRIEGRGLISSSYASSGVKITGIKPSSEARITLVARSVVEGDYLEAGAVQSILIGRKMSEKLKVGLGDKVVLTVQTIKGELAADAYRVAGIFKTISSDFDKYMVYLPIDSARRLLEIDRGITGIVVRMEDTERSAELQSRINERFKSLDIEALSWEDLEPLIAEMVRISKKWNLIFFVAIFIILSIGIINTQNIAVYERMHELGVIKAMGTGPRFIFSMVMMETFFLGLVGIAAGFFLSFPVILYFSINGLNLAMFSEGMEMFGLGARIYFEIEPFDIIFCACSILATAFFGAFFPALRASRLEPVRAIRYS
ncbi:MAG: ABC transporter permease [Proteobacteria bacterium]|nr:ABC transporter permease [Pseudomonadota bacterium]